jgi:hypothetical protein
MVRARLDMKMEIWILIEAVDLKEHPNLSVAFRVCERRGDVIEKEIDIRAIHQPDGHLLIETPVSSGRIEGDIAVDRIPGLVVDQTGARRECAVVPGHLRLLAIAEAIASTKLEIPGIIRSGWHFVF